MDIDHVSTTGINFIRLAMRSLSKWTYSVFQISMDECAIRGTELVRHPSTSLVSTHQLCMEKDDCLQSFIVAHSDTIRSSGGAAMVIKLRLRVNIAIKKYCNNSSAVNNNKPARIKINCSQEEEEQTTKVP